jgi:hypothetical protein
MLLLPLFVVAVTILKDSDLSVQGADDGPMLLFVVAVSVTILKDSEFCVQGADDSPMLL